MNTISQEFEDFVRRIFNISKLQISDGILPLAFENELIQKKEAVTVFFKTIFSIYEEWCKCTYSSFISDFIHSEGISIFSIWLAEVYPFDYERTKIDCPKGPSTEDALVNITYIYNKAELDIIQKLIQEFGISVDVETVAKILLIEAIKSISKILSEAVSDDYKIFTDDVSAEYTADNLIVKFKGAGRVIK
ncbi:MAG: hypothetical protein ACTSYB_07855 [Candidatus Helarchaeota archaeon]